MGKQWKQCQTLSGGTPKSLQMVTAVILSITNLIKGIRKRSLWIQVLYVIWLLSKHKLQTQEVSSLSEVSPFFAKFSVEAELNCNWVFVRKLGGRSQEMELEKYSHFSLSWDLMWCQILFQMVNLFELSSNSFSLRKCQWTVS